MEMSCLSSAIQRFVSFCIWPDREKGHAVIPVFTPFQGCEHTCIFCAQHSQTGVVQENTCNIQELLNTVLDKNVRDRQTVEIAFYGGTFTSWPRDEQIACIKTVQHLCAACTSVRIRCSTRPDALEHDWLKTLEAHGLNMVEVGVQSFNKHALDMSERGYHGDCAREGCLRVREAGLECGVQLLPGMPGHTPEMFLQDVAQAIALGATCMRWYPCLVLEGTRLAEQWRAGAYQPWDLPTTLHTLGAALCLAWEAGVPVIRMGLAPGPELAAAILAGPWHPALGSLVQAEALLQLVARHQRPSERLAGLVLPAAARGFVGGERGSLWPRWTALGVTPQTIHWRDGTDVFGDVSGNISGNISGKTDVTLIFEPES